MKELTVVQIAKIIGTSKHAAQFRLNAHGCKPIEDIGRTHLYDESVIDIIKDTGRGGRHSATGPIGRTIKEMAKELGLPFQTVKQAVKNHEIKSCGKAGQYKIYSDDAFNQLKSFYYPKEAGVTIQEIADALSISYVYAGQKIRNAGFQPIGKRGSERIFAKDIIEKLTHTHH
jgi:hypothetical protein